METKYIKPKVSKHDFLNVETSKANVNVEGVRDFTKRMTTEKKEIIENSFAEIKKITNELENLKLQNEEMEILINDIMKEKYQLQDLNDVLKNTYADLLKQYTDTKMMLHNSHDQNVQLSEILEKMRENEKCLVAETHKLRKYGSLHDSTTLSDNFNSGSIASLEKEVKFWQKEAENLSKIIEINDKKWTSVPHKQENSKKKNAKQIKRANRVITRSHSVEESQRKSKEFEFERLKNEKIQMKNLLNDLETQVVEIQNNVLKISKERQKYKDFYYSTKEKLEHTENINVNLERRICDLSNENSKFSVENEKISKELQLIIDENENLKEVNEGLMKEISIFNLKHGNEIKCLETKLSSLMKENHDIVVRSSNLKSNIVALESDFKEMEDALEQQRSQAKEHMITITAQRTELVGIKQKFEDKSDSLNRTNTKLQTLEENIVKLKKTEELLTEKMDITIKELTESKNNEKVKEEFIKNLKLSYSAQIIKMENHMQNAEQIISSKIKLISSLELKVSNDEEEIKSKDEEILNLKKFLNSKQHEIEVITHKYDEAIEGKKSLEQHIETLSSNNECLSVQVKTLTQMLNESKKSLENFTNDNKRFQDQLLDKQDQIQIMQSQIERSENDVEKKCDEIMRLKKVNTQLQNEVEQKESNLGSLLSILESKEQKIVSIQSCNTQNEQKMKEYIEQLNLFDEGAIQSSARNNALEKEIESLNNNAIRLTRQKDSLSQMLSDRNKSIGQLQAQLADIQNKWTKNAIFKKSTVEDLESSDEISLSNSKIICNTVLSNELRGNYDKKAERLRAHSHNGRSAYVIEAT